MHIKIKRTYEKFSRILSWDFGILLFTSEENGKFQSRTKLLKKCTKSPIVASHFHVNSAKYYHNWSHSYISSYPHTTQLW